MLLPTSRPARQVEALHHDRRRVAARRVRRPNASAEQGGHRRPAPRTQDEAPRHPRQAHPRWGEGGCRQRLAVILDQKHLVAQGPKLQAAHRRVLRPAQAEEAVVAEVGVWGTARQQALQEDAATVGPRSAGGQGASLSGVRQILEEVNPDKILFGSDWPVVSEDPMLGIHAALNRHPWLPGQPDESQTLEETIAGYTKDAAYTEFQEHEKGMIRTGYLADLVLLSDDLFTAPAETIHEVRPVLTVCDGRVVFEAE